MRIPTCRTPWIHGLLTCAVGIFLLSAVAQAQPQNLDITPNSGTGPVGAIQTFTAQFGASLSTLTEADVQISLPNSTPCFVQYLPASNGFYLSGAGPVAPGSSGAVQGSVCTLYGANSMVSYSSTNGILSVSVSVSFNAAFAGAHNLYISATDNTGYSSPLQQVGTWTVTAPPAPDLTIAETHSPTTFAQLQSGTFTITVTNSGTLATSGSPVTVTDSLPQGLNATSMSGTGWTCTIGTLSCTRSDILAVGSSYPTIALVVTAAPNAPTSVTNTPTVSGGGDVNAGNDWVNDLVGIGQSAYANMATPAPGSALSRSAVTFSWNAGATGTQYYLYVGTTGPGSSDVLAGSEARNTSQLVTGLPTNGGTVYLRLSTCGDVCSNSDYTYAGFQRYGLAQPDDN